MGWLPTCEALLYFKGLRGWGGGAGQNSLKISAPLYLIMLYKMKPI
jgi:hypothetical protein